MQKRAVITKLRDQGLLRWRLPDLITILPSLIHLSLILFFIGLALYLSQVHKLPAFLTLSMLESGCFRMCSHSSSQPLTVLLELLPLPLPLPLLSPLPLPVLAGEPHAGAVPRVVAGLVTPMTAREGEGRAC